MAYNPLARMGNAGGGGGGNSFLNQVGPTANSMLTPYMQRGNEAYGNNQPDQIMQRMLQEYEQNAPDYRNMPNVWAGHYAPQQRNQMAANPQDFMNNIMRGYTPSEGYRFREGRMQGAARNAASAGGVAGTQEHELQSADLVRSLMGQDQQEFLNNILGIQESGLGAQERYDERRLSGTERHQGAQLGGLERLLGQKTNLGSLWAQMAANRNEAREGRGFQAANNLTDILGTNLGNMESLRVQENRQRMKDEARQREAKNRRKSGMMGFLGQLAGAGIGAAMGGPGGAQAGANVGGAAGGWF